MKFVSKEAQNSDIVATILNTTKQPGGFPVMSFRPRNFVQMASDKRFNYHSGLWLLLNHIILSQASSKLRDDNVEDNEEDNRLEKIDFADPLKDAKSVASYFSFRPISSRTE